jgi:hypothetical protein
MESSALRLLADLMKDMPQEKWIEFAEMANKNFWTLQNNWMANTEKKYGQNAALEFDCLCYGRAIEVAAYRLKKFFDFTGEDDMSILAKIYQLTPAGSYVDIEFPEITNKRLVRRVKRCPMQLRRLEQGQAEILCKPALIEACTRIAKVVNPEIKITYVLCPPDPHPEDLWCEVVFEK